MKSKSTMAGLAAIVAGGLLLGTASSAAAAVIFGTAHGGSGGASTLYSVNSTTGAATAIGAGLGFNGVSAMDFDPTSGTLYGIGRVIGTSDQRLISVNTATGVGTSVADIADSHSFGTKYSGMSFRSDGTLFVYLEGGDGLGTLSLGGTLTGLGNTGVSCCGNGISFNGADVLYHANEDALHTLSQLVGTAAVVGSLGISDRVNSMDFENLTGTMFVSINGGSSGSGPNFLGTVDLTTGVASSIGQSVNGLDGIAVLNAVTVSEPGTLAILGLGLVDLGVARRRKGA